MEDIFEFKNPKVEYLYKENKFVLLEDYYTPECIVPKGFKTNGASTGRVLQTFYPSYYKYFPAVIVHDYMYETGCKTKEYADLLFQYNIKVRLKMSVYYYGPMYQAVKFFGGSHYSNKKKAG
jgi:Protein of unknown function (DUF1353)